MKKTPYRELVGSLLWTSLVCHPEVALAASHLTRFNANPGRPHWEAAKRALRFLKGMKDHSLTLGGDPPNATALVMYSDADWGENIDDRRSTSGYVAFLGNTPISWSSKKQTTVALSSTEAEYMAAAYAARHAVWLRNLLDEVGVGTRSRPTPFFLDNKGSIDLTKDSRHHQRTKHIDIAHHFVRERVESGCFQVTHCPSSEMLADGFTKALPRPAFERMVASLRIVPG